MSDESAIDKEAISKKLRELRLETDLSQRAMARELFMDSKQYANLDRGIIDMRISTLICIARYYNIPVGDLFEYVSTVKTS